MHDKCTLGAIIGSGQYGVVRAAVDKVTGMHYAVKSIPKARPLSLVELRAPS